MPEPRPYNYLGFGGLNTHCTPLVVQSIRDNPITSGAPSAELGYSAPVKEVEETTARFVGKEAAVVVGMGFATNSTVIPAICGPGDLIISDALNHNSIVEGARLSGAKIRAFKHNCVGDLELILQDAVAGKGARYNKILVIVEGIYSMEGELCCLPDIVRVCKMYGAYVWLDEAHSIGAVGPTGRGVCEELGVDPADVDIMMGTFTKSFGAAKRVRRRRPRDLGARQTVRRGVHRRRVHAPRTCARRFSRPSASSPARTAPTSARRSSANFETTRNFSARDSRRSAWRFSAHHPSPVMPVMLYQPYKIGDFSRLAFNRKLAVVVVGAPATPVTYPRVRFCVSAAHSREDLADALAPSATSPDEMQIKFKTSAREKRALRWRDRVAVRRGGEGTRGDGAPRHGGETRAREGSALAAARALRAEHRSVRAPTLRARAARGPPRRVGVSTSGPADTLTGITEQPRTYDVTLSSQDVLALV